MKVHICLMVFFGRGPTWCVDDCFNQSIKRDELRKNYRMFSGVRGGVPTPWPPSWSEFTDSDANTWSKGVWPKMASQDHWTITREEGIVVWGRMKLRESIFYPSFICSCENPEVCVCVLIVGWGTERGVLSLDSTLVVCFGGGSSSFQNDAYIGFEFVLCTGVSSFLRVGGIFSFINLYNEMHKFIYTPIDLSRILVIYVLLVMH